jgi:hypothetical protein
VPLTAAIGILGPNQPIGGAPCNASTTFLLWLPPNPSFAGIVMSSLCAAGRTSSSGNVTGSMTSNCLTWVPQ